MPKVKEVVKNAVPRRSESPGTSDSQSLGSNGESSDGLEARKYLLRVTAGPSYDVSTHQLVRVNGPDALEIESEQMTVRLKVRIRGYNGLPRGSPNTSPYFSDPLHKHDQYSIGFSFVPKVTIPSKDLIWGNDFDHPIRDRLPPGFNFAFRIVKQFIDPGLECDAYADKPWLYGPALSCWFALRIGDKIDETQEIDGGKDAVVAADEKEAIVHEGADGSGVKLRQQLGLPAAAEKRRRWFLDEANRQAFEFEKGRVYHVDFFNPYLDFSNFALKLPGFSLGVLKYIGDKTHTLRYVFKNPKTGDVFFVVELKLLHGQDVQDALREDQEIRSRSTTPSDID